MPERPGIDAQVQTQKVKDIATLLPHVAVPAGTTRELRAVDAKGGVTILAALVMCPEGTAAEPILVQLHVAPDRRERILRRTPVADRRAGLRDG